MAFSLGYPDLEAIPPAEMLAQVRRIARAAEVPVTADLEAGLVEAAVPIVIGETETRFER